jgi:hypothetical protein
MQTPYTTSTGIQIGVRYLERGTVAPIDDPDMLLLQEALLATPNYISTKRLHNRVMAISYSTGIFLIVFAYLVS